MRFLFIVIAWLAIVFAFGCGGGGSSSGAAGGVQSPDAAADTTPPRIASVSGLDNGWLVAGQVTVEATAVDDNAVATMELRVDGEPLAAVDADVLIHQWDARELDPGAYVLTFVASDPAGNQGSDSIFVYVIDYQGEDVVIPGTGPAPSKPLPTGPTAGEPTDSADGDPPSLIISGIADGDLVFGQWYFSAVGFSQTGVNAIAVLIDGKQVTSTAAAGVSYVWDTTQHADGAACVTFIARGNSGLTGELVLQVEVDNTNDHSPPELLIENSTWKTEKLSGKVSCPHSHLSCETAGTTNLVFEAVDQSEVSWFKVEIGTLPPVVSDGAPISLILTPDDYESSRGGRHPWVEIHLEATDVLGHTSKRLIQLQMTYDARFSGYIDGPDGERISGVPVFLFEGAIEDPHACDRNRALESTDLSSYDGHYRFSERYPLQLYTLYVRYNGMHSCVVVNPGPGYDYPHAEDFVWERIVK